MVNGGSRGTAGSCGRVWGPVSISLGEKGHFGGRSAVDRWLMLRVMGLVVGLVVV